MIGEKFDPLTGEIEEALSHDLDMEKRIAAAVEKGYRRAYEIPDPIPLAPPIGFKRQPTIAEQMQLMIRSAQLAATAEASGMETFNEADDFSVPDMEPYSPYEIAEFDPVEALRQARREEEQIRGEAQRRDAAELDARDAFYRSRGVEPPPRPETAAAPGPAAPSKAPKKKRASKAQSADQADADMEE